jgi:hypothetical protein
MIGLMTGTVKTSDHVVQIPDSLIRIVADVLAVAWRHLLKEYDNPTFCKFVEDDITEKLYMILGEIDDDPMEELRGLAQLQSPVREGNMRNYNNSHPDKQPDLTWRPAKGLLGNVGNTATAAIFIECKPVDQARSIGSTYCKKGLIRFVNGDYSWRVNRAMMVGYVRNRSTLPGALETSLANPGMSSLLGYSGTLRKEKNTIKNDTVWSTTHNRSFKLNNMPVGDIQIDHLWLYPLEPCDSSKGRGSN